jgi:hypothetical protein
MLFCLNAGFLFGEKEDACSSPGFVSERYPQLGGNTKMASDARKRTCRAIWIALWSSDSRKHRIVGN